MIRLNLQMFGGRGGGSGNIGAGHDKGNKGQAVASDGGPGSNRGGGGRRMDGGEPTVPRGLYPERQQYGKENNPSRSSASSNGSVTKLEKDEKYTIYKIREDGRQSELSSGVTGSEAKSGVLHGASPDPKDGIWKDKHGRKYRVVRSR